MSGKVRNFTENKSCSEDERVSPSYQIVKYGHESCEALLDAFRKVKGDGRGAATDEQQDILRAMLVMAGACIDSSIKQLFRDCVPSLIKQDEQVRRSFEEFAERALKQKEVEGDLNTKLLAQALTSEHPLEFLSESYVYDLTGSSLQSSDQLFSAANALGLNGNKDLGLDEKKLKSIFQARNQIIHEMDIDFTAARRNRFQRKIEDMIQKTNELLRIAEVITEKVQAKLPNR